MFLVNKKHTLIYTDIQQRRDHQMLDKLHFFNQTLHLYMFSFFDPCNSCSISTLHSPWLNLTKRACVSHYKKDKKPKRATSSTLDSSFLVGWLSQKAKKLVMSTYCNWRTSQSIRTVCTIQVSNILLHFGGPMKVSIQAIFSSLLLPHKVVCIMHFVLESNIYGNYNHAMTIHFHHANSNYRTLYFCSAFSIS